MKANHNKKMRFHAPGPAGAGSGVLHHVNSLFVLSLPVLGLVIINLLLS